jgi:hypothetical protein
MAPERELGAFVGRFETDNMRRGLVALAGLLLGVVITGLGIVFYAIVDEAAGKMPSGGASDPLLLPCAVFGVGLGLLLAGGLFGWQFASRRGEVFMLYEGGLVREYAGRTRIIEWDEIAKADNNKNVKDNAFSRALGGDVSCLIKLKDGGKVVITGFTANAANLAKTVEIAVRDGIRPNQPGKV